MKILAIGDIVGDIGIKILEERLSKIIQEEKIDFVIANVENSGEGIGITKKAYNRLSILDIDVMTLGNHTWSKKDVFELLDNKKLIRPSNFYKGVPGRGYEIFECKDKKIAVINLIGRVYIENPSNNPFQEADIIINKIKNEVDIIIVDFHAEASAEKIAMAYYLKEKASVLFCTHTHVQTADEQIIDGLGYITDLGMTGPKVSVLGMKVDIALKRFVKGLPERYKQSEEGKMFNGCIFDIDEENCRCIGVKRLNS